MTDYERGYADAMNWKVQNHLEHLPSRQPQEPIAWMHNSIRDNIISHRPADLKKHPERWTALYPAPSPCPTCEALARTVMLDQTSHDTKRPWVGLTDEEKKSAVWSDRDFYSGVLWAEAKLKEKNT